MAQSLHGNFWPRLGITAAVLAVYRLGGNVLLPGIDSGSIDQLRQLTETYQLSSLSIGRWSIFALGVMPLLNALILAEIVKLVAPDVRKWELAAPANRARMDQIVAGLALFLALLQAGGYASALEDVSGLVSDPGMSFRALCIVTLVASTALVIAFARVIDSAGLGFGVWLLFLTPALTQLPSVLAGLVQLNAQGAYGTETLVLSGAFCVLAIAGVVSIVRAARAAPATVETCIWAPIMANTFGVVALLALGWFVSPDSLAALSAGGPAHVVWYIASASIIVLAVALYEHSYAWSGQPSPVSSAQVAGTLAAIFVAGSMLQIDLQAMLPLSSTELIIAAAVATALLVRWGGVGEAAQEPPAEEISPQA